MQLIVGEQPGEQVNAAQHVILRAALKTSPILYNSSPLGTIAAVWGIGGFLLLLAFAIYRLTPIALDAFNFRLQWYHWLVLVGNTAFMAYSEGYKGFQKGYSPRLVSRARRLAQNPTGLTTVLAPLFCMSFFGAERRRIVMAWIITVMVIALVIIFHMLPQPWRGVLDAGVVVGLSWGLLATIACVFRPAEQ